MTAKAQLRPNPLPFASPHTTAPVTTGMLMDNLHALGKKPRPVIIIIATGGVAFTPRMARGRGSLLQKPRLRVIVTANRQWHTAVLRTIPHWEHVVNCDRSMGRL